MDAGDVFRILVLFAAFSSICLGSIADAETADLPVRDMYLRARQRTRQGSEIRQIESAARFVWRSLDQEQSSLRHFACAMRKIVPEGRGGRYLEQVAGLFSGINGTSLSESLIALTRSGLSNAPVIEGASPQPLSIIHLDKQGAVVSGNPVWNACIRGTGITSALIKSNQDRSLQRTGHQRTWIPWSCRDYHKGKIDVWQHPDYPELSLVLDEHGRLMSALPVGYLAVKGGTIASR